MDAHDVDSRKERFEELKVIIRSLVIPYKNGTKVHALLNDYKEVEGHDLPYKQLGYSSPYQLLQRMPDVVRFGSNKKAEYVLFPIVDESCVHIQTMVQEQCGPKRHSSGSSHSRFNGGNRRQTRSITTLNVPTMNRYHSSHHSPFSTFNQNHNRRPFFSNDVNSSSSYVGSDWGTSGSTLNSTNLKSQFNHNSVVLSNQSSSRLPPDVQNKIRAVLSTFENGLAISDVKFFYAQKFGSLNPSNFGFRDVAECLRSIPHVCTVCEDGKKVVLKESNEIKSNVYQFNNNLAKSVISTRPVIKRTTSGNEITTVAVTTANDSFIPLYTANGTSITTTTYSVTTTNTVVTKSAGHNSYFDLTCAVTTITTTCLSHSAVSTASTSAVTNISNSLVAQNTANRNGLKGIQPLALRRPLLKTIQNIDPELSSASSVISTVTTTTAGSSKLATSMPLADTTVTAINSEQKICNTCPKSFMPPTSMKITIGNSQRHNERVVVEDEMIRNSKVTSEVDKSVFRSPRASCSTSRSPVPATAGYHLNKGHENATFVPIRKGPSQDDLHMVPAGFGSPSTSVDSNKQIRSQEAIRQKVEEWTERNKSLTQKINAIKAGNLFEDTTDDSENIPPLVRGTFKRILSRFSEGIPANDFCEEYYKETGFTMDVSVWGYTSPVQMFYSLPSIFVITPPDISNAIQFPGSEIDHIVYDAKNFPQHVRDYLEENNIRRSEQVSNNQKKTKQIGEKVLLQTLKIVQLVGEGGISVSDFGTVYELNFNEVIYPQQWNFDTFYDFFDALACELPIVICGKDDPKVCLQQQIFNEWLSTCMRNNRILAIQMFVNFPNDAVIPGDKIETVTVPDPCVYSDKNKTNHWIATLITSAINPSCLWLHLRNNEQNNALNQLMNDLSIYEDPVVSEEYKVPEEFVVKNLYCCAKFHDNQWHRAKITRVNSKRFITIFFIDYGGLSLVGTKTIRLLKKQFATLPAQAVQVSLRGIEPPPNSKWPMQCRSEILKYSDKDLWLACLFYPKVKNHYEVLLCDTTTEDDFYIHEALIAEKLAVKISQKVADDVSNTASTGRSESEVSPNTSIAGSKSSMTKKVMEMQKTRSLADVKRDLHKKARHQNDAFVSFSDDSVDSSNQSKKKSFKWMEDLKKTVSLMRTSSQPLASVMDTEIRLNGNEELKLMGRVKINGPKGTKVVHILSINSDVYCIEDDVNNLLKDFTVGKEICHSETDIDNIVLKNGQEMLLHKVGLSPFVKSGVILISMRNLMRSLDLLQYRFAKSAFIEFFKQYEEKYKSTAAASLIKSLRELRLISYT